MRASDAARSKAPSLEQGSRLNRRISAEPWQLPSFYPTRFEFFFFFWGGEAQRKIATDSHNNNIVACVAPQLPVVVGMPHPTSRAGCKPTGEKPV